VASGHVCKYGERGADGKCPKAPCKYGARDADGYCPKKPSASSRAGGSPKKPAATNFLDKPRSQGTTASGAKRAPTTVRKEAEKVLTTATTATLNSALTQGYNAYKKDPEAFKGSAKEIFAFLGKLGLLGAAVTFAVKLGIAGGEQGKAQRDRLIDLQVFDLLNRVKGDYLKRGFAWKPEYSNALIPQYRAFFLTQALRIAQSGGK